MTVALMWEAKAAEHRGPGLLAWVRAQELAEPPLRRETFTAPGDRVLVITWWSVEPDESAEPDGSAAAADNTAVLPELPDPPAELSARPVHRWRFEQV